MRKTFNVKWNLGEVVELKTDTGIKRIITGYIIRSSGKMYEVARELETSWHQEVEIEKYPQGTTKKAGFK